MLPPPLNHDNMVSMPSLHLGVLRIPGGTRLELIRSLLERRV